MSKNHPARRRKDIWKDITVKRIEVYAVTLSAELSGSYNSAVLGKRTVS